MGRSIGTADRLRDRAPGRTRADRNRYRRPPCTGSGITARAVTEGHGEMTRTARSSSARTARNVDDLTRTLEVLGHPVILLDAQFRRPGWEIPTAVALTLEPSPPCSDAVSPPRTTPTGRGRALPGGRRSRVLPVRLARFGRETGSRSSERSTDARGHRLPVDRPERSGRSSRASTTAPGTRERMSVETPRGHF